MSFKDTMTGVALGLLGATLYCGIRERAHTAGQVQTVGDSAHAQNQLFENRRPVYVDRTYEAQQEQILNHMQELKCKLAHIEAAINHLK